MKNLKYNLILECFLKNSFQIGEKKKQIMFK